MAEPTASNYPSSYEDNDSLLGPLEERQVAVVKTSIGVAELQITLEEPLTGLTGPIIMLFEGGEMWWIEDSGISVAGGDTIITLASSAQRAYHNSILQPHGAGEEVYFTVVSTQVNQYKRGIEALQQNGFRLGTEAEKVTYESSALAGEGWLATDNGKVYYCFATGTFVWVNRTSHSELLGLTDDDHASGANAYHNDTRALAWHTPLTGDHINSGDDHDHFSTSEGSSILRIVSGLDASKGTPSYAGQLYFATDFEGGTLYISTDGATWSKISGAPAGAIAGFPGACPSGWSRYTNLDGKYIYVDNTSPGSGGGSHTHGHTYSAHREHYHPMAAPGTSNQTEPGNHSHQYQRHAGGGGQTRLATTSVTTGTIGTSQNGSHTHTASVPATTSTQTGVASPVSTTENGEPPYKEVVWCEKD